MRFEGFKVLEIDFDEEIAKDIIVCYDGKSMPEPGHLRVYIRKKKEK